MLSLFADQLRSIDLTLLPFTLNVNSSFTSKPARRIFPAFFYYLDANVDFGICIWYCIGNKRTSDATKRRNIPSTPCYDEPFEPFPFLWAVRGSKKCLYLRKRNAAVIFIRRSKTFYGGMNFLLFFFLSLHFPSESTSILADYKYEYRIRIDHRFLHRWFTGRPVQQRWSYEYFSTIRFRQPASHRPFALLHHDLRLFRIIRHKFWHCCSIRKLQFYA